MRVSRTHLSLLFFSVLAVCLSLHPLYAQEPIAIGLFAGTNISTEDFFIGADTGRSTVKGFIFTGQTDWPLYTPLVLQDRLSYIRKGVQFNRDYKSYSEHNTLDLAYLELSLAAKWKFGFHDLKPYIYLGPRAGLILSATETIDVFDNYVSGRPFFLQSRSRDIRNSMQSIDFGLDMGAGLSYPVIPHVFLTADIGFGLGLTNIIASSFSSLDQAFSRDLKITAGFLWEVFPVVKGERE